LNMKLMVRNLMSLFSQKNLKRPITLGSCS
jgi:hypothetical protein